MLIIEDGSGVTGADSYATALQLAERAAAYGWTLPPDTQEQEVLLRRAAQQMNAMGWKGRKARSGQSLAWPRADAKVDGEYLPDNLIPGPIAYGQMALAAEIHADDIDPPDMRQGPVKREKVDVIEVEYAVAVNDGRLLRAAPDRPSAVQFRDYLQGRGWYVPAIRA